MTLGVMLNTVDLVGGGSYATFHDLVRAFKEEAIILADLGFRTKKDAPDNLKLCCTGILNERMVVEPPFPD